MRRQATRTHSAMLLGSIAGLLVGAPAVAQEESKASIHQIEAPLRGPEVSDDRAPGVDPRFSAGMERSRESERPIPLRMYEKELRTLAGADVSEDIRLSTEQQQAIRKALDEHRRATRAFFQEHRAELAAIRGAGGAADATMGEAPTRRAQPRVAEGIRRGQGQRGVANDAPADASSNAGVNATRRGAAARTGAGDMSPEAREKFQALRAAGPQQGAVIEKIWGMLNEAQRSTLEARFERYRAEEMRKREQRKNAKRGGAEGVSAGAPASGEMRARPEAMTPEQRRERVEQFRGRRGGSERGVDVRNESPEGDD